jgi:uncharacterized membrane protein
MFTTSHLHPMLVHFPIALVALGFLTDLLALYFKKEVCLSKFSFYLLISGTLSAMIAVFTGVFFTEEMTGAAGDVQKTHEFFAILTLCLLVLTSVLRIILNSSEKENKHFKRLALAIYGLAAIFVGLTALFGGNLVYNYLIQS